MLFASAPPRGAAHPRPGVYREPELVLQPVFLLLFREYVTFLATLCKGIGAGRVQRLNIRDAELLKSCLSESEQAHLVTLVRGLWRAAPPIAPETPYGKRMSVRMTSAGGFGWVSDRTGYRYLPQHPSGADWPAIPAEILDIWKRASGLERLPDCCLVNYYGEGARMGMHQDRDEADFSWPVVSVSLGDDALFRIGNTTRGGKTESVWLSSGDVLILGGAARLAYHGVDRIRFGSSRLLEKGGRINLTMRVVT